MYLNFFYSFILLHNCWRADTVITQPVCQVWGWIYSNSLLKKVQHFISLTVFCCVPSAYSSCFVDNAKPYHGMSACDTREAVNFLKKHCSWQTPAINTATIKILFKTKSSIKRNNVHKKLHHINTTAHKPLSHSNSVQLPLPTVTSIDSYCHSTTHNLGSQAKFHHILDTRLKVSLSHFGQLAIRIMFGNYIWLQYVIQLSSCLTLTAISHSTFATPSFRKRLQVHLRRWGGPNVASIFLS